MSGWWASPKRLPRVGARIRVQGAGQWMLPELQDEPEGVVEERVHLCLLRTRTEMCYLVVRYPDGVRWVAADNNIFVLKREDTAA